MTKLLKIFISILSMYTLVIVNNHYVDALSTDKINVYFIVSENKLEKKAYFKIVYSIQLMVCNWLQPHSKMSSFWFSNLFGRVAVVKK